MKFQLGEYQLEYLKKYEYIKLSDWRILCVNNKINWYYVGDTSQLNKDELEKFYDERINNLIKDRNYYIKNSIIKNKS